jgi:hypothetical protein
MMELRPFLSGLYYLYVAFVRQKDLFFVLNITCLYIRTHGVERAGHFINEIPFYLVYI